ncbi:fluoride efflux transporter FluC [Brachybacterium sp. GCM10030267]|uniref:fluoride efflux transporter FluC n=1 Tax=unclassified Brachybacterium TaxID=2623841 RepID=UPI00360D45A6
MNAGTFLLGMLLVSLGGAAGSVLRWGVREYGLRWAAGRSSGAEERVRPWLTFAVNVVACFLLGLIVARLGAATGPAELAYLLLAAGVCAGLSTLSTAAVDVVDLIRRGRIAMSVAYFLLSIGAGMAALWSGLVIAS